MGFPEYRNGECNSRPHRHASAQQCHPARCQQQRNLPQYQQRRELDAGTDRQHLGPGLSPCQSFHRICDHPRFVLPQQQRRAEFYAYNGRISHDRAQPRATCGDTRRKKLRLCAHQPRQQFYRRVPLARQRPELQYHVDCAEYPRLLRRNGHNGRSYQRSRLVRFGSGG